MIIALLPGNCAVVVEIVPVTPLGSVVGVITVGMVGVAVGVEALTGVAVGVVVLVIEIGVTEWTTVVVVTVEGVVTLVVGRGVVALIIFEQLSVGLVALHSPLIQVSVDSGHCEQAAPSR